MLTLTSPTRAWTSRSATRFGLALAALLLACGLGVRALFIGDTVLAQASLGRILFGHAGEIWISDEGSTSQVTSGGRYWGQPDWAPDGARMAIVGWGANSSDIFTLSDDRTELRQITRSQSPRMQNDEWIFFPKWSPDGQSIAYLSDRSSNNTMLWLMRPDGSNQHQLTRPRGTLDAYDTFAWSPDGTQIAATGYSGRDSQIYLIDVAHPDNPIALTSEPGSAFDPTWSPDGRYVGYVSRDGKRYSMRALEVDAGEAPVTLVQVDTGRSPRWDPRGNAIAYLSLSGGDFELFTLALGTDADGHLVANGRPTQLTSRFGIDATSGLSWAP